MGKSFLDGYDTYDTSGGFGDPNQWKQSFKNRMNPEEAASILKDHVKTPHEILNVSIGATPQEIKKAFRALMMQWHPDRNPHRHAEAEAISKTIIAAYSLLTN